MAPGTATAHVLFGGRHRQRAGVVLHKDAQNTVAARSVVYHPLLEDTCHQEEETLSGTLLKGSINRMCAAERQRKINYK